MKRYSTTSIRAYAPAEDPAGEFVRYEDAAQRIAELEREIKDYRQQIRIYRELEAEHEKDAERFNAVINGDLEDIAICKSGWADTPWVSIGPNEARELIDAAMREGEG